MSFWVEAGLAPSEFWDTTPREYAAVIKGISRKHIREHNLAVTAGFMQVLISRDQNPKPLANYVLDPDDPSKTQGSNNELPKSDGLKRLFSILAPMAKNKG